ncbi:hypothetical protein [Erythrobacter sp. F6033]|uniref:hypothetical protein n=1 Tax=Erythrobacter sp. F6033 TaxID=2926401 RepID=UPI001FF6966E|nr:hypothetical protein [Erythrobacter sp. F6033]MCK0128332.1 hypothetical protein [Erythrobacter sp. F6033]
MTETSALELPAEHRIAIAYTPEKVRGPLTTYLNFDQRLARIVAGTTEPMLGQMRLAWWRDMLMKPIDDRPKGDVVLDAIGCDWSGDETSLIKLVDAWEVLVVAEKLDLKAAKEFGAGRSAPFLDLADTENLVPAIGAVWAIADAASQVSDDVERAVLIEVGLDFAKTERSYPSALRGIAVLDALASRALKKGGRPLMEGRGASLTAFRAALFGR